jgi:acyl-CoA hydrolase
MFLVLFSIQKINTSTTNFSHPNIERDVVSDNDSNRHYIGELFGGGVVFWVDTTGQHGLICSMTDIITPSSKHIIHLPTTESSVA